MEIIAQIFQIIIIPLLGILVPFVIKYISNKTKEILAKTDNEVMQKYISLISQTVQDCVIATNQTYVDALKKDNKFDAAAQKMAFEKTLDSILIILSEDAKDYIANITGDINTYLTTMIEMEVNKNKLIVPTV